MNLKNYLRLHKIKVPEAAAALGVTRPYLSAVMNGKKRAGPGLALRIDKWTDGKVPKEILRPDLWSEVSLGTNLDQDSVSSCQKF